MVESPSREKFKVVVLPRQKQTPRTTENHNRQSTGSGRRGTRQTADEKVVIGVKSEENRLQLLAEMKKPLDSQRYLVETAREGKARLVISRVAVDIPKEELVDARAA